MAVETNLPFPDLTVGLAVFNGAPQLRTAIESLLAQSYTNFVLIISDNASTDDTQAICESVASRDHRVCYFRQAQNIGAFANFRFLLQQARTPYFMWAAHDDRWDPRFIAKNLALLRSDPRAVVSMSKVAFERDGVPAPVPDGTSSLAGSARDNLRRYWQNPADHSRYLYGIHSTRVLRESFPDIPPCHALDWLICALALRHGHVLLVPEILMWRTSPGAGKYLKEAARDNRSLPWRLFPVLKASLYALKYGWRDYSIRTLGTLVLLNLVKHHEYMRFWYPRIYRVERLIYHLSGLHLIRTALKEFLRRRVAARMSVQGL